MKPNLTQTSAQLIELYRDIDYVRETVFVGTNTGAIGAHNYIKQAYSVGWAKYLTNSGSTMIGTYSNVMGVVLPSLREETCLLVYDATDTISLTQLASTTLDEGNTGEFNYFSAYQEVKELKMWDLKIDQLFDDSWCTEYTNSGSITTITPGYTDSAGLCGFSYDDTPYAIDFTRPVTDTVCDDTGEIWTVWLEC